MKLDKELRETAPLPNEMLQNRITGEIQQHGGQADTASLAEMLPGAPAVKPSADKDVSDTEQSSLNTKSIGLGMDNDLRTREQSQQDQIVDHEVQDIVNQLRHSSYVDANETLSRESSHNTDSKLQVGSHKSSTTQLAISISGSTDSRRVDESYLDNKQVEQNREHAKIERRIDEPGSPTATRATNLTATISRSSGLPEPEPEVRFNFHLFLEQLRHRTANPVAKYLRSFLVEFGKKNWTVQEQVQIVGDFLAFISGKMAQCDIWKESSQAEFDNSREGMEKLVMSRLYTQTFSPEISPPLPAEASSRRRNQKQQLSGRRGQHQEDVERDDVLNEKMQIFGWIEEQHLDIRPVSTDGKRFLSLAQQELIKMNNYRAPRDKVICILNACKVIFGLLRSSEGTDTSADAFMPLLIYTVLRAKPRHLVSNIQYIFRFRNQDKLGGEAGYYLSSLMGVVQFIENLDRTALSISEQEFERQVEESVAAIAERRTEPAQSKKDRKVALQEPELDAETKSRSPSRPATRDLEGSVQGILRNIQKPLANIGRMFSDEADETQPSTSEAEPDFDVRSREGPESTAALPHRDTAVSANEQSSSHTQSDVDVDNIVETLCSMFPSLDKDVISDIVIAKEARVGAAVDACLSMTS